MSKELFGKALKCKNKKQEARRKRENWTKKKWKQNLLTVEMGALKMSPPCWEGERAVNREYPPPQPQEIIMEK